MQKHNKQIIVVFILLLSGLSGFVFSLYIHNKHYQSSQALANIQTIQTFHYPARFVKQLEGDPEAGKKIFNEFCSACHSPQPQIDINAPRIGDKKTWESIQKQGIETLLTITINGAGAMPARGGCFECSDQQLRETIQYILSQSLKS